MAATAPTLAQSRAFGLRMLATMRQHEGDRFVWGATGPTRWDCSGFSRWAHETTADPLGKHAGYYLPHNASAIRYSAAHLKLRVKVPILEAAKYAQPGDAVFFHNRHGVHHCGIAEGGNRFYSAAGWTRPAWVCSTTFDFYAKYSIDSSAEAQASGRYTHVSICSFVGPGVSATTTAPTPATPAPKGTVTKRAKAGVKLNVRTAPSTTASVVGKLAAGTAVTGTLSGGWMKITTGTYAGRFVSATYLV